MAWFNDMLKHVAVRWGLYRKGDAVMKLSEVSRGWSSKCGELVREVPDERGSYV